MVDFKKALRAQVHDRQGKPRAFICTTENIQETKINLKALGMIKEEYKQRQVHTLKCVFDMLNFSRLNCVVLRNFDRFPDKVEWRDCINNRLQINFLVSDYFEAKHLIDATTPDHS